ncbi:hypothetical protein CONLIGDRAFT_636096 [Coniochaeta ligniaria NRRL 30616]|uniref:Uncharacterized protein n=1 Tax=Coniochaeta ligniaria NRRL 30616 TaxID=1408157 RepID=A0A1J7IBB3_9PEZI|nr:hypothetical protein CONLIGDRAFT_636096 [Coniochaeta ligniaria NRRL 30616]
MLEREFRNLQLLRGESHVVQLVPAVVSTNPYRTSKLVLDESSTSAGWMRKLTPSDAIVRDVVAEK